MGVPLSQLARMISTDAGRMVIDATNLEGDFEFALTWNPKLLADRPVDRPVLSVAIEEQLGLKLQSDRGPLQVVVIDRIERPTPD